MTPILLDTNAYAAFKRGEPEAVAVLQQVPTIAVNSVVLGERLGGFAAGSKEQQNRAELATFLGTARIWIVPVDRMTADRYASIYATLRKAGTPIPTNDIWIAASALQHNLRLFTYDAHFRGIPGLAIGITAADFAV